MTLKTLSDRLHTTVGIPLNTGERATDRMPQAKQAAAASARSTLHNSCCHTNIKGSFQGATSVPQEAGHTCQKKSGNLGETTEGIPQNLEVTPGILKTERQMNRLNSTKYVRIVRCQQSW